MDVFAERSARPMLVGAESKPFHSPEHLFEIKFDGVRCLAYLDRGITVLQNRRGVLFQQKMPELAELSGQVKKRCILDGELIAMVDGKPDFTRVQHRSVLRDPMTIRQTAKQYPASLIVFDILYYDGKLVTELPLLERKALLQDNVADGPRMSLSRYVEERGDDFFRIVRQEGLEGVVAKRRDSLYEMGKRTSEWVKIKNLLDGEFVVCGYLRKKGAVASLVLGQYGENGALEYRGHVAIGLRRPDFRIIEAHEKVSAPPFLKAPPADAGAVWLRPDLVCTVEYIEQMEQGLRQPVFKGLRDDKTAREASGPRTNG